MWESVWVSSAERLQKHLYMVKYFSICLSAVIYRMPTSRPPQRWHSTRHAYSTTIKCWHFTLNKQNPLKEMNATLCKQLIHAYEPADHISLLKRNNIYQKCKAACNYYSYIASFHWPGLPCLAGITPFAEWTWICKIPDRYSSSTSRGITTCEINIRTTSRTEFE